MSACDEAYEEVDNIYLSGTGHLLSKSPKKQLQPGIHTATESSAVRQQPHKAGLKLNIGQKMACSPRWLCLQPYL